MKLSLEGLADGRCLRTASICKPHLVCSPHQLGQIGYDIPHPRDFHQRRHEMVVPGNRSGDYLPNIRWTSHDLSGLLAG